MAILGTNFIKFQVERKGMKKGLKINNNLGITDVQPMTVTMGKAKQPGIRFIFEYTTVYEPGVANFLLEGEVIFMSTQEVCDLAVENFKNKKKISNEIMTQVMNSALVKSTIKSLDMAVDMGLPPPIKLPRVKAN